MKELQEILQTIEQLEKTGTRYAIATVVKVSGSTYRGPGARMLISEDGKTVGNISGGCLENDVITNAREVINSGEPRLVRYDTTAEEDIFWGTGLGCGGITHIFIEPQSSLQPFLQRVRQDIRHHQPVVAATVFEVQADLPIAPGARLMFDGSSLGVNTIPGGEFAVTLEKDVRYAYQSFSTETRTYSLPGGSVSVLMETLQPPQSLLIFGGGPDVFPVISLANQLGWQITVIDHREPFADPERFPDADRVILWQEEAFPEEVRIDERTVCVVMTHHYLTDKKILLHLLRSPAAYIGILGPAKRAKQLLDEVRDELPLSCEITNRIYSPVGLDIGAETAEEIALSVIAEIMAVLHHREGGSLRERRGPIHQR